MIGGGCALSGFGAGASIAAREMMAGGEPTGAGARTIVYCIVPFELAVSLHEPLRQHFAADPSVEVVVEQRGRERRRGGERRSADAGSDEERRRIRNAGGRRVGPRRAPTMAVDALSPSLSLPRKARRHADRLVFVERVEPSEEHLSDLDSARLVTRLQAGDEDAFATLYLRYFDRVYSYLLVIFRNDRHETEDVAQQVFVGAFEALPRYERRAKPFRAWLFTIARNQAISRMRQLGRSEPVEPALLEEQRDTEPAEETVSALSWLSDRELVMFVERLPLAQRQVLVLRYLLDLPTKEIGAILGRSVDDVRMLEHRAVRFLEARLTAVGRGAEHERRRPAFGRTRWMPVTRQRRWALYRKFGGAAVR